MLYYLFLIELPEADPPGHEDGGRLWYPEDFPAEALKERGEVGLAGGLPATRAASEDQLVDPLGGGDGVTHF